MIEFVQRGLIFWFNDVISFLISEKKMFIIFISFSIVALFGILRYQYKKSKQMWCWDGVPEIFFSLLISALITGTIYLLPLIIFVSIFAVLIFVLVKIIEILVKLSVRT